MKFTNPRWRRVPLCNWRPRSHFHRSYHRAALKADPQAMHLADAVQSGETALKQRRQTSEDREDVRVEGFALLMRADFELDDRCRAAELDAFSQVHKNRSAPEYRAAFPHGLSALIALRGEEQERAVRTLCAKLRERMPVLADRHEAELVRLAAAGTEAERAWKQAETDAAAAFAEEQIARSELVRQLHKSEGALRTLYPGQPRRVRSFFRPTRRRGAASDDGGPEVPPTPPGDGAPTS